MAVAFDGDDYGSLSYSGIITALPFSVMGWFKVSASISGYPNMLMFDATGGNYWGIKYENNTLYAYRQPSHYESSGLSNPGDAAWHSYALVFNETQTRISIDGATFTDLSHFEGYVSLTTFRIANEYAIDGYDVRLYNTELTQQNVTDYYNGGSGDGAVAVSTGLIDHFKLVDNTATSPNAVEAGRPMTLTGNPTTIANPFEFSGGISVPAILGATNQLTLHPLHPTRGF